MKRYEAYKPTGLEWFSEIPQSWEWRFLSQVAHEQTIKKPAGEMYPVMTLSYGEIKRKANIDAGLVPSNYDNYQMLYRGNIVLRLIDLQNDHTSLRTGLVKETGIITSAYTCIAPTENAAYVRYLLHSYDIKKVFYGFGGGVRQSIGYKDIRHLQVPVPSRTEQDQIVRYLDWQVSKINRLIAAKRKQIELLSAKRQSELSAVMRCGLDANVQLKETGIRWIGAIPENWTVSALKRCATLQSGITLGKQYPHGTKLISVPYLRVANVQIGYVDISNIARIDVTEAEAQQYQLPEGCVLMTEGGDRDKLGRGCVWNGSVYPCIHQNHIFAVTTNDQLLSNRYLEYLSASDIGRMYFDITAIRTTNLACTNATKVLSFTFPLPNREEQGKIVEYLDNMMASYSNLIDSIQKQIITLADLRTRLISDVVTGQIDVRGVEVPDFAYTPDVDASDDEPEEAMEPDTEEV